MEPLKGLIHEIHRRSLWQVTGIFLAASWGALQVIETITETAGLPDWTPSMALVLLIIGLPICLATAVVQEGMPGQQDEADDASAGERPDPSENLAAGTGSLDRPSTRPSSTRRLLTWKNAILGGVGAFALLGFSLIAYFVMWETGIGPVGNLVAQGVITQGERLILADFDDDTGEGLGDVVTEALRVDLTEASVLQLVEATDIRPVLALMQVDPETRLGADLAREVGVRAGVGAVLEGSVQRAGTGYLVTATLREIESGRALATFRVSADGPDGIIPSIDKLSQDVREKTGESLRQIKAGEPLEQVTTSSLEALRLYSEASRLFGSTAEDRVIDLLEEAVAIDPEFAMAWRKLAAAYNNDVRNVARSLDAATEAYEHRDRLTLRERYLAEALYYSQVLDDAPRTIEAYRAVLAEDPDDPAALNNSGNAYMDIGEYEQGNAMYRRAISGPGSTNTAFGNLILGEARLGNYEAAADVLRDFEEAYPDAAELQNARFHVALLNGATSRATEIAEATFEDASLGLVDRSEAATWLAKIAYREGRFGDARTLMRQSARMAAQVTPSLEAVRIVVAARIEYLVGSPELALEHIRDLARSGVLPTMPIAFSNGMAANAAVLGDLDTAERILADFRAAQPEAYGDGEDIPAPALISLVRDGGPAFERIDAVAQEAGCIGTYCYESELGWAAARDGDVETAIRMLEQLAGRGGDVWAFIGLDPMYATLRLAPLYEEAGDTARAIAAYEAIIEMWAGGDREAQARVAEFRSRVQALTAAND